uniref:SWI/SNF-related matrix-associated actin-dependent regulator of chromatin subfamily A containing DEAD/H box 1-like isoform X2 n=1 Tax=Styela clava TaxID=7725 RepID=UPI00193958A2|nr:SWI/SNF-related matrix-associated actin-dependent regulator of chromatin subfamily A containing DEAD/H box 1-like isoform X2 [Styela clava]
MLNLNRFKYDKGGSELESPVKVGFTPDIIPETPPMKCNNEQAATSGLKRKRKFDLSSDEEGSESVTQLYKKTRITHFMQNKSDIVKKKTNDFISPDSGSDENDDEGTNCAESNKNLSPKEVVDLIQADDRLPTLRQIFPEYSEDVLDKVCDLTFTIDGAITILTRKRSEDIKNHQSDSQQHGNLSQDSNSYDSPLFVPKRKNCLRLDSEEKHYPGDETEHISKKSAAKRLGLSSSSESEGEENSSQPRGPFPRLNCVVTNGNEIEKSDSEEVSGEKLTNGTSDDLKENGVPGFYSKKNKAWKTQKDAKKLHKEPKSFLHESLTMDNATDENFNADFESGSSSDDEFEEFGSKRKKNILEFFQDSSLDELMTVHTCSQKKAEIITGLRPFKSWNDLLKKLADSKRVSTDLIPHCADLLKERVILQGILKECQSISNRLASEIEKLHCHDHMTEGNTLMNSPSTIPSHLKLKPYQLVGLNWLTLLHRNKVNGVLADEMGLGKTVQTIAFLAHLLETDPNTGPHAIIVPSSTLDNWCREFSLWCPSMEVVVYRGSQQDRRTTRVQILRGIKTANVILTTYNSAISTSEDKSFFRKLDIEYAVFDEGHMLKNMSSQRYVQLMKIKAARKILLTGTPLQNNLLELMSLIRFVMPHMFEQTTDTLVRIFTMSNSDKKGKFAKERIKDAKDIMQPFVLRRLKDDVLKQLPSKESELILCEMTKDQKKLYEETKERFRLKLNKQSAFEMKSAFIELRKVANHQFLRRNLYTTDMLVKMAKLLKKEPEYYDSQESLIVEDMTVMTDFEIHRFCKTTPCIGRYALDDSKILDTGKFRKLDKLLPDLEKKGYRVAIFSQFTMIMDIIEQYLNFRKHKFVRLDGSTPVNIRLDLIDQFQSDPSILVFLLSTKAGGLGINLTAANVVILHDIDMNPYNDKQAEDRCHRLGQTKNVKIMKLISKDTIEEGMLKMAENKLKLEQQMTSNSDDSSDIASLLKKTLSK